MGHIIEIPAHIVIDALAGKTSLKDSYGCDDNDYMFRLFKEGWKVISCSFKEGEKEAGEPSKIVFELVWPDSPFWPPKLDSNSETKKE
jgi:hypothetical protein